jgi:hypothetical protein
MDNILGILAGGLIALAAFRLFSHHTLQIIRIQKESEIEKSRADGYAAVRRNESAATLQAELTKTQAEYTKTQAEITKQMRAQVDYQHVINERDKDTDA